MQLRGVNVSGLEFVYVQKASTTNPWGGATGDATPNWSKIKSWQTNVVRLPLNEASWLGYTCTNASGASQDPDPSNNYQSTVIKSVSDATAAGFYVILDLHWTAPADFCPLAQNPIGDLDHSLDFWTSVATAFKSYPNVMFELFNEPYIYSNWLSDSQANLWSTLRDGGSFKQYVTGGTGTSYTANYTWQSAGMQGMLDAIRATGATNVVLVAGVEWAQDLTQWLSYKPQDSLSPSQIAAVWHAYPSDSDPTLPKPNGAASYTAATNITAAGYPVIITEIGDHVTAGATTSPFVSKALPWADTNGISYLGWTWDNWGNIDFVLIKDAAGTPTDGYGKYFHDHLACVAAGTANCT